MDPTSTPDSWDQSDEGGVGDSNGVNEMSKDMSKLNVNAAVFVPGQNPFANEFVPFGVNKAQKDEVTQPEEKIDDKVVLQVSNGPDNTEEKTPDDWTGGENGTVDSGGGDEAMEDEMEEAAADEEEEIPKPKPKKRLPSESAIKKEHLNIVFIGHVDAGKSTIGGHIMYLTGQVDKRTLEKFEREAREKNRESWYLSWALDTNIEERDKGKTVEVGRAYFETEKKHFTILDAPGHKSFVPNMIGGASQADVAVLVISARKGEFETGFERGGQTREHAMLVKTAGVSKLVVVVNKMDDPTVEWDENRFKEIQDKLTPYLKKCGFKNADIYYLPVSGLTGYNLKTTNTDVCPWYTGPSLITYLDDLPNLKRNSGGPVRLPIVDRYKDMGTICLGKIESGTVKKGQVLTIMPNRTITEVLTLWLDEEEADSAFSGENIKIKLKGVEEEDILPGFVLCSPNSLCHSGRIFDAQIVILEYKSIICAGYSAVMHIHTAAEEVTIKTLICEVDKKTGEKSKTRPRFIKQDQIAIVRLETQGILCMETFKDFPQMGRFNIRDEGHTVAIGKVLKVVG